ncbi:hypothetical protein M1N64_04095, partial [Peptococcaceae bacterium]|nr:hypothetical protein [Peptococcaceae bacterium]
MFKKIKRQLKFKPVNNQRGSVLLLVVLTMTIGFALCAAMLSLVQAQDFKIRSLEAAGEQLQPKLQHQYAAEAGIAQGLTGLQRRYAEFYKAGAAWVGEEDLVTSTGTYRTDAWIDWTSGHKFNIQGYARNPDLESLNNPHTDAIFERKDVFDYVLASKQDLRLEGGNVFRWDIYGSVVSNRDLNLYDAVTIHGNARAKEVTIHTGLGPDPKITGWQWDNPFPLNEFPDEILAGFDIDNYVDRHYGSRADEFGPSRTLSSCPPDGDVLVTGDITIQKSVRQIKGDIVARKHPNGTGGDITIAAHNLNITGSVVAEGKIHITEIGGGRNNFVISGDLIAEEEIDVADGFWGVGDYLHIQGGSLVTKGTIRLAEDIKITEGDMISTEGDIELDSPHSWIGGNRRDVEVINGDIIAPQGLLDARETGEYYSEFEVREGVVAVRRFDAHDVSIVYDDPNIEVDGVIYVQDQATIRGSDEIIIINGSMVVGSVYRNEIDQDIGL